jgi:hypothetical protein
MCVPRYVGKGYSKEFCDNLSKVKAELTQNNFILVDCCDDICKLCPKNINGKCENEETVKALDLAVKKAIENGKTPKPSEICQNCQWFDICKNK